MKKALIDNLGRFVGLVDVSRNTLGTFEYGNKGHEFFFTKGIAEVVPLSKARRLGYDDLHFAEARVYEI